MNKLQFLLTKWYVKTCVKSQIKEIRRIELAEGVEKEIVVFSNKNALQLGQLTVFDTIIIEESVFTEYSADVQKYVLTHEYGHTKQRSRYILLPLVLTSVSYLAILFIYLVFMVPLLLVTQEFALLANLVVFGAISFALATTIFSTSSWWLEGKADYYALVQLGKGKVLDAQQEIKDKNPKPKLFRKVIRNLLYPPIGLVVRIYDCIDKRGK